MTNDVVIVDRISVLGVKPDYCIHGETLCVRCNKACWLGSETVELVKAGTLPLCIVCAEELRESHPTLEPSRHVRDHRRADGPH